MCDRLLAGGCFSYAAVKRALDRVEHPLLTATPKPALQQSGSTIRPIAEYQAFWDRHSPLNQETLNAHVDR